MAVSEDAATVLENFIHDVANMPAEIAHLLEEIQAKDKAMEEHRSFIAQRDVAIQGMVKRDGGHALQPKEATYLKGVREHFDQASRIQREKCILADKVAILLDRHVKRLDQSIVRLVQDGAMPPDPHLPTLLDPAHPANLVPPAASSSGTNTGVTTPLAATLSHSAGSSTLIAEAAAIRLRQNGSLVRPNGTPASVMPAVNGHNPLTNGAAGSITVPSGALTGPANAIAARQREMSAGAEAKRRRTAGAPGTLQLPPSNLRQSSAGPSGAGTPKVSTPGGSRAGSAGPRTKKGVTANKKLPTKNSSLLRKTGTKGLSKKQARKLAAKRNGTSPSTTGDDDDASGSGSDATSDAATSSGRKAMGKDGTVDEEMEDAAYDDDGDDQAYCVCQKRSYGDMVACDNEKCELEWFHWGCVGLTAEPKGKWLCPNCSKLPASKIKYAR